MLTRSYLLAILFSGVCMLLYIAGAYSTETATSHLDFAQPYFEVLDKDGQMFFGVITQLDNSQITVNMQGEQQILPIASIVKIRNLAPSPYQEISSGRDNLRRTQTPFRSRQSNISSTASRNEQRLINLRAVMQQSNAQMVKKTFPNEVMVLELKDGSRLTVSALRIAHTQAFFHLLEQQNELSLPLEDISAVRFVVRNLSEVFNPPDDWLRLSQSNTDGDRIVVGNPGSLDVYAGILGEVNDETVSFDINGEVLPVPRHRIFGLLLHDNIVSKETAPTAALTLWSGTRGMISDIRLENGDILWNTAPGLAVSVPLDSVSEIDFGEQGVVSLFDFERHRSEFSLPLGSIDVQPDGKPEVRELLQQFYESRANVSREIILDGTAYCRGITLRGTTTLEYQIPRPYTALRAIIGIEDQYRPHASATLQILADSQELGRWELRGDAPSQRVVLDLPPQSRVITIMVTPLHQAGTPTIMTIVDANVLE